MDPAAWLAAAKEFGFPVALCGVLLLTIRWQNSQLVKASTALVRAHAERIEVLEGIVSRQGREIAELQADRLRRADEYANDLKSAAVRYASAVRDFYGWMDKAWSFIIGRPPSDYAPHPAGPHPPAPPPRPPPDTGTIGGKA